VSKNRNQQQEDNDQCHGVIRGESGFRRIKLITRARNVDIDTCRQSAGLAQESNHVTAHYFYALLERNRPRRYDVQGYGTSAVNAPN
jgi:hypothetical protein